ncbi:MAG: hypothetical protein IH840_15915 [Candidatus Heimdallarchaeota archaeon]|nr:hypothetical protein [Candidatus Heimdallarchaeota archaeon]
MKIAQNLILLFSLIIITNQGLLGGFDKQSFNQNQFLQPEDAIIINLSHFPIAPFENQNITIFASVSRIPIGLTNLTLNYIIGTNSDVRVEMVSDNNLQFQMEIPMQAAGTSIKYWAELYVDNTLSDRSPNNGEIEIKVSSSGQRIFVEKGIPLELSPNYYHITTQTNDLQLLINLTKSASILINVTSREKSPEIPNFTLISNTFDININDSNSFSTSLLTFLFNQTLIDELGAVETNLQLLTNNEKAHHSHCHAICPSDNSLF